MNYEYSEIKKYHEKTREPGHDHCKGLVAHLQQRIDGLISENEVLRQKTQTVVKKVETNIVERKPGLDEDTVQKISDLERRLSEADMFRATKTKEIEEYQARLVKFNDLRGELDVLSNRNHHLEQQLTEKVQELEALRQRFAELSQLREQDRVIITQKESEFISLHKRIEELEILPNQIAIAKKNAEALSAEIDRLSCLARERDQEIAFLQKKIQEFEHLKCVNPKEHDELKARLRQVEALSIELNELKGKYTSLCTEYEREISIVRSKEKEIVSINQTLQQTIQDSRKAIDKELSHEEKLEREVEALVKRLEQKNIEIEEWKKKAASIPDLQKSLKSLDAEYLKLQDKCHKLEEINAQLNAKIEGLNKELYALRDELKRREKLYSNLEKEKTTLVTEFERTQKESSVTLTKVTEKKNSELEAMNAKIAHLNQEIYDLQKQLDPLRNECARLNEEKIKISKALQEHAAQEMDLAGRVDALRREKELLGKEIANLVAEKERLKGIAISKDKQAQALDQNMQGYAQENEHLRAKVIDLEKKLASVSHLLSEREAEICSLKDTLLNVTNSQKELLMQRDKLAQENSSLSHRVTELETSVTTITSKYNQLEGIYNQIRGATEKLGEVHEQLVETSEETAHLSHMGPQVVQQKKSKFKQEETHAHQSKGQRF